MTRTAASLVLGLAALCGGCTGVPVHIDNAVPPGVDHSKGRIVEGEGWGYQALLLIPMGTNTRHERAWNDLLAEAGDAYVTDVQLKEDWFWGVIGTLYHSTFRATAYPRASTGTAR